MVFFIIIGALIFIPVILGYYHDYKKNPNEFNIEFHQIKIALLKIAFVYLIYIVLTKIF